MSINHSVIGKKVAYIIALSQIVDKSNHIFKNLSYTVLKVLRNETTTTALSTVELIQIKDAAVKQYPLFEDIINQTMLEVIGFEIDKKENISTNYNNTLFIPAVISMVETFIETDKERAEHKNMLKERIRLNQFLYSRSGLDNIRNRILNSELFDMQDTKDEVMTRIISESNIAKKEPFYDTAY